MFINIMGLVVQLGPTPNTTPQKGFEYFDPNAIFNNTKQTFRPNVVTTGIMPRSTIWDGFGSVPLGEALKTGIKQQKRDGKNDLLEWLMRNIQAGGNLPLPGIGVKPIKTEFNFPSNPGVNPDVNYHPSAPPDSPTSPQTSVVQGGQMVQHTPDNIWGTILRRGREGYDLVMRVVSGEYGPDQIRSLFNYMYSNIQTRDVQNFVNFVLTNVGGAYSGYLIAANNLAFEAYPIIRQVYNLLSSGHPLDAIEFIYNNAGAITDVAGVGAYNQIVDYATNRLNDAFTNGQRLITGNPPGQGPSIEEIEDEEGEESDDDDIPPSGVPVTAGQQTEPSQPRPQQGSGTAETTASEIVTQLAQAQNLGLDLSSADAIASLVTNWVNYDTSGMAEGWRTYMLNNDVIRDITPPGPSTAQAMYGAGTNMVAFISTLMTMMMFQGIHMGVNHLLDPGKQN